MPASRVPPQGIQEYPSTRPPLPSSGGGPAVGPLTRLEKACAPDFVPIVVGTCPAKGERGAPTEASVWACEAMRLREGADVGADVLRRPRVKWTGRDGHPTEMLAVRVGPEVKAGTCEPGLTFKQLENRFGKGQHMRCRVIPRYGERQGQKPDVDSSGIPLLQEDGSPVMVDKIRLIDDSKRNSANDKLMRQTETTTLCRFTLIATIADKLVEMCRELGCAVPRLVFSVDDLEGAYRQIATSDPEMSVICTYSYKPGDQGVRFFPCNGHTFGAKSSVTNFTRTPTFICHVAQCVLAIPCQAYVDDYCAGDFYFSDAAKTGGAAEALNDVHNVFGFRLEPCKHQPPAQVNTFLGVTADTTHLQDACPYIEFRPDQRRTTRVTSMLQQACPSAEEPRGKLTPAMARSIRGKLLWLLAAAWGSVGRAALQPLTTMCGSQRSEHHWSPRLETMTNFLGLLFDSLPPLRCFVGRPARPKVVVYTDAQYSEAGRKGIGVVAIDTEPGERVICGDEIPRHIMDWIHSVRQEQTNINHCELLAALVAILTFPEMFRGRNVLLFTDNLTVLRCLVHGYMRTPELAHISNAIHLLLARLQTQCYASHVPGDANPADIPSRVPFICPHGKHILDPDRLRAGKTGAADTDTVNLLQAQHWPTVFPSAEQLQDLAAFL